MKWGFKKVPSSQGNTGLFIPYNKKMGNAQACPSFFVIFRIQSYSAAGPGASFAPVGAACFAPAVRCGSSAASDSQAGIHPHNESSRFVPPFTV